MIHNSHTYHPILSESDISRFLDRTNGLHDALLTGGNEHRAE